VKKQLRILFMIFIVFSISLIACGGSTKTQPPQESANQSLDRPAPPENYINPDSICYSHNIYLAT
jgi:hypothetical protein